jgi:hypothetical protein
MSDFKDMTKDSKPWPGNEVKPFTFERFMEGIKRMASRGMHVPTYDPKNDPALKSYYESDKKKGEK